MGIDGANAMISKANIDDSNDYILARLPDYLPDKSSIIFTRWSSYTMNDPESMLKIFYEKWLKAGGWAVVGIDHYAENEDSLSYRICRSEYGDSDN